MNEDQKKRLADIRARVEAYREHEHDAYAFDEGEIREVRELRDSAPADIEFLLGMVDSQAT